MNGRAILNVPGQQNVSLSIYGLALFGAVDSSDNGAGILFENGNANLVVSNSWIYDNQDGILTGGVSAASTNGMTVTITHSEINDNGTPPDNPRYGFDHNLYISSVNQLTVTDSYIHDALGGHEIKSRALALTITDNRIFDGPTATTSYSIDLSDGGVGVVTGNIIEKGPAAPNRYVVHFAGEGTYANSSLLMDGNTIINDRIAGATALYNQTRAAVGGRNIPATITGNTLYNIPASLLRQDNYAPPFDYTSNNVFLVGADPALDTSHPFNIPPAPIPEPSTSLPLSLALLVTAVLRRWRAGRRAAPRIVSLGRGG